MNVINYLCTNKTTLAKGGQEVSFIHILVDEDF